MKINRISSARDRPFILTQGESKPLLNYSWQIKWRPVLSIGSGRGRVCPPRTNTSTWGEGLSGTDWKNKYSNLRNQDFSRERSERNTLGQSKQRPLQMLCSDWLTTTAADWHPRATPRWEFSVQQLPDEQNGINIKRGREGGGRGSIWGCGKGEVWA